MPSYVYKCISAYISAFGTPSSKDRTSNNKSPTKAQDASNPGDLDLINANKERAQRQ